MIEVTLKRNKEGICNGFLIKGHAGYGAYGTDIVCAAVSALVINTVNSIEKLTTDRFQATSEEKSGTMELTLVSPVSRESSLLLESLILGLQGIKEAYGNQYMKIC